MRPEILSDALSLLPEDMIEETARLRQKTAATSSDADASVSKTGSKHRFRYLKYAVPIAACLCIATAGWYLIYGGSQRQVLMWNESFSGSDYFSYNNSGDGGETVSSLDDSAIYYDEERYFSGWRQKLEEEGVIPVMADYPLFDCRGCYDEDGTLISLSFSWHQRGDNYSDLSVTAGYEEVPAIEDCIAVPLDENGNIIPDAVTVTERDGIRITAKGSSSQSKTLTFESADGWYQISGSWNDDYDAVAALLDWFWEHPADFSEFGMDKGDVYETVWDGSDPEAFEAYIPDFESFGYVTGECVSILKNSEPYSFEGHYIAGADKASVLDGSYLENDDWQEIHWCIDTEPDVYAMEEVSGTLRQLTEQTVTGEIQSDGNIAFMWDNMYIKVYTREADDLWEILHELS